MRIRDWSSDVCSSDLLRIVLDEGPAGVLLWDGVARAEVHHVEGADRADVGKARADEGAEAVRVGGEHAAHHHVADFGGGEVDGGGQQAAVGQRSEEHTSELQSLMRISYAGFRL